MEVSFPALDVAEGIMFSFMRSVAAPHPPVAVRVRFTKPAVTSVRLGV